MRVKLSPITTIHLEQSTLFNLGLNSAGSVWETWKSKRGNPCADLGVVKLVNRDVSPHILIPSNNR